MHLHLAGSDLIYLNSSHVVSEILEKRSAFTTRRDRAAAPTPTLAVALISGALDDAL
jgi:hypothetical protein